MTTTVENARFLLYIDILGFSDMSRTDPAKINELIASRNAKAGKLLTAKDRPELVAGFRVIGPT